jgi:hypothetical protein
MITLGTESCGTNLLGGTVFFHRLAHTFTFVLAKLSHLLRYSRSESVAAPLAVRRSVFTFTTTALVILLVLFLTVVVHIDVHIVVVTLIVMLMVGRRCGQVARCSSSCHFFDGITHASG